MTQWAHFLQHLILECAISIPLSPSSAIFDIFQLSAHKNESASSLYVLQISSDGHSDLIKHSRKQVVQ